MPNLVENGFESNAWPFKEARNLIRRMERTQTMNKTALFETGYGPSGLPHIGTFGEVSRTLMIKRAYELLADAPARLICFSDDLDGLRKVPLNVPNREMLAEDLNLPLSSVRDPFNTHKSFADHNNARLRTFLDRFGFEYEFISSTDYYKRGLFDEMLITVLERFDEVMEVMLPSLGRVSEGRKETYSPFLPISPKSGRVLQVPTLERDIRNGQISYREPDGEKIKIPVTGGNVKLQWKPDWAMRWAALGVDYEMFGKDLIPSADLARRICRVLGQPVPIGLNYELFLDENGKKISKSTGLGISIDDWLEFASPESLELFMFQKPQTAKRLHFDIIPKMVDEYHQHLNSYVEQDAAARLNNPAWHIHNGNPPPPELTISYTMLLNIAAVASAEDSDVLWGFIKRYLPEATPESNPELDASVKRAVKYFQKRVAPSREFRHPDEKEAVALADLRRRLLNWKGTTGPEELQSLVYSVGKEHNFVPLRDWFRAIYEILLGSSQGPRFGGFIALYGVNETAGLIERQLTGQSNSVN